MTLGWKLCTALSAFSTAVLNAGKRFPREKEPDGSETVISI
jgi:hypothetical protein